jgi:hypothetical protein
MRRSGTLITGTMMIALALFALPMRAHAQTTSDITGSFSPPAGPLKPEEIERLGKILSSNAEAPALSTPAGRLKLPALPDAQTSAVTRFDKPDGSSTITIKRTLPTEWQANFGADLNVRTAPIPNYDPQVLFGRTTDDNSGAAWASLGLANLATIDTRIDPANDQGRLGTTLKQSLPIGDKLKVTLQDTYSMTESLSAAIGAADLPALPNVQTTTTANTAPIFGNQQSVKFDILPTGTSLGAAVNSNSFDPVTHKSISADQRLWGPLHISTAVNDIGQPTLSKSVIGSFKLNW